MSPAPALSTAALRAQVELQRALRSGVLTSEPMSRHTSFQVGGPADLFVCPRTREELHRAVGVARELGLPVTVIGRGSNLLVDDAGVRGLVIKVGRGLDTIRVDGNRIRAGSGASMGVLATVAARHGLHGLEFGILVPGNLGGALYMNAGARTQETKDVVVEVRAVDGNGDLRTLGRDECEFSYRMSAFQRTGWLLLGATMELPAGDPDEIRDYMANIQEQRKRTMPVGFPSGGATFKRPPGDFAGRLIEAAGCKGWREGGFHVSLLHANYFINDKAGTAADARRLIERVRERVLETQGRALEREVIVCGGEDGGEIPYEGRGGR